MLEAGLRGTATVAVTAANTARAMGSGTLEVFATPALAALAEQTCWQSVAPELEPGSGTVGAKLSLEHTAPTPVGMHVTCESELIAVEGRKLTFTVAMRDEKGPVGQGVHERVIINDARFLAKAAAKRGYASAGRAACWVGRLFPAGQREGRRLGRQIRLLGAGLRLGQQPDGRFAGAKHFKVKLSVIRRGDTPPFA